MRGPEKELIKRSWRYLAPTLSTAPDEILQALSHSISRWIRASAKVLSDHRNLFIPLADRILRLDFQDGVVTDEPLMSAINHPVGHITQALLDWWYRDSLKDNQGIPDSLRPILIKTN